MFQVTSHSFQSDHIPFSLESIGSVNCGLIKFVNSLLFSGIQILRRIFSEEIY